MVFLLKEGSRVEIHLSWEGMWPNEKDTELGVRTDHYYVPLCSAEYVWTVQNVCLVQPANQGLGAVDRSTFCFECQATKLWRQQREDEDSFPSAFTSTTALVRLVNNGRH